MKNIQRTTLLLVMNSWFPKRKEISFFLQHLQNYFFSWMAKDNILNLLSGFTQCMCRQRSALATQLWLLLSCCGQMMVLKGISANSSSSQIENCSWSCTAPVLLLERLLAQLLCSYKHTDKGPSSWKAFPVLGEGSAYCCGTPGAGPCVGSALRQGQEFWEPCPCQGSCAAAEGEPAAVGEPHSFPSCSDSLGCKSPTPMCWAWSVWKECLGLACHARLFSALALCLTQDCCV